MICGIIALFFLGRFAFDDLYISFRYAEHLASGNGLTWNIGRAPVEGYTNFLLVLVLAVFHLLDLDPLTSVQLFNITLTIGSAIFLARLALGFYPEKNAQAAKAAVILTTIAYCVNPFVWQNALSGLETSLFTFLLLLSLSLLAKAEEEKANYLPGFIAATLAMLARPDGVLLGLLATVVFFSASSRRSKVLVASLLGFVLPTILYELWRISYFGAPLPNTYYVKVTNALNVFAGRSYVTSFYKVEFLLVLMAIAGAWKLRRSPVLATAVLWILGLSVFYVIPTPIQGFYYRFLFSVLTLLTAIGIGALVRFAYGQKENYRWAMLTVGVCGHLLINWRAAKGEEIQAVIPEATAMYEEMGEMLRTLPGADSISFAYQDAGVVPYYSKIEHYDLVGLNDRAIAHASNTSEVIQYLAKVRPDMYLLPAERPVEGDSCWKIFHQGHGRMGEVGPAIVESDLLSEYVQVGRYLYIGYDILIYVKRDEALDDIIKHVQRYPYKELSFAGVVPCFR